MLTEFQDKVEIHERPQKQDLIATVVAETRAAIDKTLTANDHFVMAVSGGSSPKPLFHALAHESGIPWERGVITLVDERFVPPDDDDSNEKLVREHLLAEHAATARFIGLYAGRKTPEEAARALNANAELAQIDLAVLGMGMDGHTASLFPCSPELSDNLRTDVQYVTATPGTAPHQRISLSAKALIEIPELWLFLPGGEKLARFRQILNGEDTQSPIAPILTHRNRPIKVFTCP